MSDDRVTFAVCSCGEPLIAIKIPRKSKLYCVHCDKWFEFFGVDTLEFTDKLLKEKLRINKDLIKMESN